jgi:hypothetical protein
MKGNGGSPARRTWALETRYVLAAPYAIFAGGSYDIVLRTAYSIRPVWNLCDGDRCHSRMQRTNIEYPKRKWNNGCWGL